VQFTPLLPTVVACVADQLICPVAKRESAKIPRSHWTLSFRDFSETALRLQLGGLRRPMEPLMTDNEKIIDIAALMLKADQASNQGDYDAIVGHELENLNRAEVSFVMFAYKMLAGRAYQINSDTINPRYYDLAKALGATASEETTNSWANVIPGLVSVTFVPAVRN
jgi:hypothetical protein